MAPNSPVVAAKIDDAPHGSLGRH